ncbi:transposase domain-containing protein [Bradyrhizobium barranii subsp. barranii]|uniref:Transposase domain-containing protein n=1 Tax=Bradyrhizobium barranii subsp. barranii TaxID=2823807 RepID=A0A939MFJ7_9BRAD|nr:transposase domain-containing protein [Bradyrhizobium barranii]UEM12342.1 transposase domain-containing protein [Bradyrhizobium barranii subsp. barranii]
MTDALTRIVNGDPNSDIDELLPSVHCRNTSKPWLRTTLTSKVLDTAS